jgi:hypothetical protein
LNSAFRTSFQHAPNGRRIEAGLDDFLGGLVLLDVPLQDVVEHQEAANPVGLVRAQLRRRRFRQARLESPGRPAVWFRHWRHAADHRLRMSAMTAARPPDMSPQRAVAQ